MVAVNPLYAKALQYQNNPGDGEKAPNFKFDNVGDSVFGIIERLSEPKQVENTYKGETKIVTQQIVTLKNAIVKREGVTEEFPKITVWLQKNGHFAAVGQALVDLGESDMEVGYTFGIKWTGFGKAVGDGAKPHKFEVRLAK